MTITCTTETRYERAYQASKLASQLQLVLVQYKQASAAVTKKTKARNIVTRAPQLISPNYIVSRGWSLKMQYVPLSTSYTMYIQYYMIVVLVVVVFYSRYMLLLGRYEIGILLCLIKLKIIFWFLKALKTWKYCRLFTGKNHPKHDYKSQR